MGKKCSKKKRRHKTKAAFAAMSKRYSCQSQKYETKSKMQSPSQLKSSRPFDNNESDIDFNERMALGAEFRNPYKSKKYIFIERIGVGTYGEVYKAFNISKPDTIVAIKRLISSNVPEDSIMQFPLLFIHEISLLKKVEHKNIVKIIEVCCPKAYSSAQRVAEYNIVLEYCEFDLCHILSRNNLRLRTGHIKNIMKQLLTGIHYLHENDILHGDIKSSNIMLNAKGIIKLADFELMRAMNKYMPGVFANYTCICTLWYSSPEFLLGAKEYGPWNDMWSVGCIFGELCTQKPILAGVTEQHQLTLISKLCGSITPKVWPRVRELRLYNSIELPQNLKRCLKTTLGMYMRNGSGLHLLDSLLVLAPNRRISAAQALSHPFLCTYPPAPDLCNLAIYLLQSQKRFQ